ncbi:MAG: ferrous iron transport protein A [Candidatus Eisenbacteria bacterium]|nr:ferrous iron transport protein A [Candidatus Eisenbacteria bacterium]
MDKVAAHTPLSSLEPGEAAVIRDVAGEGAFRRRLLDMGFTKGALVRVIKRAPFGDPIEYCIGGTHVTLREQEAREIIVEQVPPPPWCHRRGPNPHRRRPRLGLRHGGVWRRRSQSQ